MIEKHNLKLWIMGLFLIFCQSSLSQAFANAGVFYGAGHQIIPIKNKDIQLKSEAVRFSIHVPPDSGQYGIPAIPVVHVEATFELINKTGKKVSLQVGFPFHSLEGALEKNALKNLHFIAENEGGRRKTTLKEGKIEKKLDPRGLFKKVFCWDETFKPHERKVLKVSYALNMSLDFMPAGAIQTMTDLLAIKFQPLELAYQFSYITKTAYTWAPPLEKAEFVADLTPLYEQFKKPQSWSLKDFFKNMPFVSKPLICWSADPRAQKKNNILTWTFSKQALPESLEFMVHVVALPIKLEELKTYLQAKKKTLTEKHYIKLLHFAQKRYQEASGFLLYEEDEKDLPSIDKFLANEIKSNS